MTIETKYKIGDEVWFGSMGNHIKAEINEINITVEFDNCVVIQYLIGIDNEKYYWERHEHEIFHTKEELLKSCNYGVE